ncbi:hypothetical protein OESDEN_25230 [Oesophagostomum dentatum]|uniref:Uncharacterized protein n=1 Tax=Oesophagostomum dentatum TaxID=61180 RepID=A0A0B1RRA8_OESDE|nr:hypothetical protein OESDEN_25230 [Oesophagostomum dentatum]
MLWRAKFKGLEIFGSSTAGVLLFQASLRHRM